MDEILHCGKICGLGKADQNVGRCPRASLALCGRFNQFRSPFSWITMRRALRKRRVFDFVPSYLNTPESIVQLIERARTHQRPVVGRLVDSVLQVLSQHHPRNPRTNFEKDLVSVSSYKWSGLPCHCKNPASSADGPPPCTSHTRKPGLPALNDERCCLLTAFKTQRRC